MNSIWHWIRDALVIVGTIVAIPIVGILGGYFVALCLLLAVVGVITAPIVVPLILLARWALWKSPWWRSRVWARWWLGEKVNDWKQEGPSVAGAIRSTAGTRPSGRSDRPAAS